MLLNEFIYFDGKHSDPQEDDRYDPGRDISVLGMNDSRKTQLTLGMLNDLRKAGEARAKEEQEELSLVRKMYAMPPPEGGALPM